MKGTRTLLFLFLIGILGGCRSWHDIPHERILAEVKVNDLIHVSTRLPIYKKKEDSFSVEAIQGDVISGEGRRIPLAHIVRLQRAEYDAMRPLKEVGRALLLGVFGLAAVH